MTSAADSLTLTFNNIRALADSINALNLRVNNIASSKNEFTLEDGYFISQILSALVLIGYAIYTAKTYGQIREQTGVITRQSNLLAEQTKQIIAQTDHLTSPRLTFEFEKYNDIQDIKSKHISTDVLDNQIAHSEQIFLKSKKSLQPLFTNILENVFQTGIYAVRIYNHGNGAVKKINFALKVTIENSQEVLSAYTLSPLDESAVDFCIKKQLQSQKYFIVPLINIGAFPKYKLEITGEYFDIGEKQYIIQSEMVEGENSYLLIPPAQA